MVGLGARRGGELADGAPIVGLTMGDCHALNGNSVRRCADLRHRRRIWGAQRRPRVGKVPRPDVRAGVRSQRGRTAHPGAAGRAGFRLRLQTDGQRHPLPGGRRPPSDRGGPDPLGAGRRSLLQLCAVAGHQAVHGHAEPRLLSVVGGVRGSVPLWPQPRANDASVRHRPPRTASDARPPGP